MPPARIIVTRRGRSDVAHSDTLDEQERTVTIESIIGAVFIGLVIGALGRLVLPGRQRIPIWLTIVVGIAAALAGSAIVGPMRDTGGVDWVELVVQVALAAAGVAVATAVRGDRQSRLGRRR